MPEAPAETRGPGQATALVEIGRRGVDLFHDDGGVAYATFQRGDHIETHPVASRGYRQNLQRLYYRDTEKAANGDAVGAAIGTLSGIATFEGKERKVYLRIANLGDRVYIDICNDRWQVIEVTAAGWRVIEARDCPVRFRRTRTMKALPSPQKGGTVALLRPLVNVGSDADFILVLAWLVGALRGKGPFAILLLNGGKGSAKSTLERLLRDLVDPSLATLRVVPRTDRDFAVSVKNSYVQALDNLSFVEAWFSDVLCLCSTGGVFVVRGLYTDDDEVALQLQCPIIISGINEVLTRDDTLDRTIALALPEVSPTQRKTEDDFWAQFNAAAPRFLGVMLDGVSRGLRDYSNLKLKALPRLADFSRWAAAAMSAFGYSADAFIKAYAENRANANSLVLDVSPIARHVIAIDLPFFGTAKVLLEDLNRLASEDERKNKRWPKTPKGLSDQLRHIVSNLREEGIGVVFLPRTTEGRLIAIDRLLNQEVVIAEQGEATAQ